MVMENSNYGRLLRIMVIGNYGVVIIVMANLWLSFFFLIMVMGNFTITITINSPGAMYRFLINRTRSAFLSIFGASAQLHGAPRFFTSRMGGREPV